MSSKNTLSVISHDRIEEHCSKIDFASLTVKVIESNEFVLTTTIFILEKSICSFWNSIRV